MLYVSTAHDYNEMFGLPVETVLAVGAGIAILTIFLIIWGLRFRELEV